MLSVIVNLLPLGIASAIGPGQVLFVTLLLRSLDRGAMRAGSFVGGMTAVRLLQGAIFGFILTSASVAQSAPGSGGGATILTPRRPSGWRPSIALRRSRRWVWASCW